MKLKKSIFIQIFLIIILLFPMFSTLVNADEIENNTTSQSSEEEKKDLELYSKSCILIERSTGRTAYEKNADERLAPASTTKVLTAIIALDRCNLDDVVTITNDMVNKVPYNYTSVYLRAGEQVTVEELLNSLLIPSGNDAGFALAIHISGSVEEFSKLMNEKAAQIGCKNSNFTNPSGIQDANHYSTARDMAKIGIYAMNYPQITNIVCKTSFTLRENRANAQVFKNTNTLIQPDSKTYYEYANGMKTGFTDDAGACLIATAKKDDMEFLAVILGAPDANQGISYRDLDAKTLFEYGFANYDEITKIDAPVLNFLEKAFDTKLNIHMIFKLSLLILVTLLLIVIIQKRIIRHRKHKKQNKKNKQVKKK